MNYYFPVFKWQMRGLMLAILIFCSQGLAMQKTLLVSIFVVSGLISGLVNAQPGIASPVEQDYEGIGYISGGIGDEERDAVLAHERDFNLKLSFAERDGAYMANVDVQIVNAKGATVLDVTGAGPFLLAKMPAGNYRIKATANAVTQQGKLVIGGKSRHEKIFRW